MIFRGKFGLIYVEFLVLGLLALTVGCGDNAREILEETVPTVSQALKIGADSSKISAV